MNSSWSVALYRFLMQTYPAEFRNRYGESVDQAFRDLHRDAFQKHGYLGVALLWFHVVPDFLFSAVETLTSKAGDFLKWRFRLQWVVACSLGFVLSRLGGMIIGRETLTALDGLLQPWIYLGILLQMAMLFTCVGLTQSRVLADRFLHRKQWVLYGLAGAVIGNTVGQALWTALVGIPRQQQIFRMIRSMSAYLLNGHLDQLLNITVGSLVLSAPLIIIGASVGLLQSAALRKESITTFRWVAASAAGFYACQVARSVIGSGVMMFVGYEGVLPLMVEAVASSLAAGLVLGLITSGPLEQILFTASRNESFRDTRGDS